MATEIKYYRSLFTQVGVNILGNGSLSSRTIEIPNPGAQTFYSFHFRYDQGALPGASAIIITPQSRMDPSLNWAACPILSDDGTFMNIVDRPLRREVTIPDDFQLDLNVLPRPYFRLVIDFIGGTADDILNVWRLTTT